MLKKKIKSFTGNKYWNLVERFSHKLWPSSANAEGHATLIDHMTGNDESASVPGPMC